jgi:hypothetical protein
MKKKYYTLFLLLISMISYGQDMKIKWSDFDGREFSISCFTGEFAYSMISGDKIEYEPSYSNNAGKVRKIGSVLIEYEPAYSNNAGKVKKVGSILIEYEPSYSNNAGKIKKVGGLTVEYEPSYSNNAGKIKSTRGNVN